MRIRLGLFIVIAVLSAAPWACGQDELVKQGVVKAIKDLVKAKVPMSGRVDEQSAQAGNDSMPEGMQAAISQQMASEKSYVGEFELLVNQGSIAFVSGQEFPGLKFIRSGEKSACVQWHADEPWSVQPLSDSLKQLLDWNALAEEVEKSSKVRVASKDGVSEVRVVLDPDFIPVETIEEAIGKKMAGAGGGGGQVTMHIAGPEMAASIADLTATFSITESGQLVGMNFDIQYEDPMHALMAGMLRGVPLGLPVPAEGDADGLGRLVSYSLKLNQQSSGRMEQFVQEATPYLQSQE